MNTSLSFLMEEEEEGRKSLGINLQPEGEEGEGAKIKASCTSRENFGREIEEEAGEGGDSSPIHHEIHGMGRDFQVDGEGGKSRMWENGKSRFFFPTRRTKLSSLL